MTSGELGGWIGGVVGGLGGLAGGMIGTYCGIKNTKGPRERAFMVKSALAWWVAVLVFLVLMLALPNPYRWLLWFPYGIFLPLGIVCGNRRQQSIRREEAQNQGH